MKNHETVEQKTAATTKEPELHTAPKAWPVFRIIETMSDSNTSNFAFAATPKLNVKKQGAVITLETVSETGKILSSVNTGTSGYQNMKDFIIEHVDNHALARIRTVIKVMHNLQV